MDATELARKMLEWQEVQAHADLLKMEIETAVLAIGKTQTVGNVKATFYNGKKVYNYEAAVQEAWRTATATGNAELENILQDLTQKYSKVSYDYRVICVESGITDIPFTQSAPSVSVKIVG